MEDDECQCSVRRRKVCLSESAPLDPDNDLRDTLVQEDPSDSAVDASDEVAESLPETLQHICGLNHTAADFLAIPARALHNAEEMAGRAFHNAEEMAGRAFHNAEEMAGRAIDKAEEMAGRAYDAAEEMAGRAYDAAEEMAGRALDKAEEMARHAWELMHHHHLPKWLKDNDFLIKGHRPQLNSFWECFKSIFRIHTETGNIWTHLLGFLAFIVIATCFLASPSTDLPWQEKAVFSAFFAGAILCLGFSWLFHTVYCHSEKVGRIFCKLDYCGISMLIMGSAVPWLYYSFYCRFSTKLIYLIIIGTLGVVCITISMWDRFSEPSYRPVRAGAFVAFGASGIVPAIHFTITDGYNEAVNFAALGSIIPMGLLYLSGAIIYAVRFPESVWPGKFDIWFQSHQIFHVFVVAAALIHYRGMSEIMTNRLTFGHCVADPAAVS